MDKSVFIHDKALCESDQIGPRTRIWAFAHVLEGAVVGADCNICDHVFIETGATVGDRVTVKNNVLLWDKVTIEDDVFLGPNAVFTNDPTPRSEVKKGTEQLTATLVKKGATIGANATIVCGVTIGAYSLVGAGAVVTSNVSDHAAVMGNPARQRGWSCVCGDVLPDELRCEGCGRVYEVSQQGQLHQLSRNGEVL